MLHQQLQITQNLRTHPLGKKFLLKKDTYFFMLKHTKTTYQSTQTAYCYTSQLNLLTFVQMASTETSTKTTAA